MKQEPIPTLQIEIFRPGSFTSMEGEEVAITPDDLREVAGGYDVSHDAPVVIGHPELDMPAYGWVKGLSFDEGAERLKAEIEINDAAFGQALKAKKFKKISASFFAPDSSANPKPGQLYLRHVGFLGAAAPAVSGLQSVQFSTGRAGVMTFNFSEMRQMSLLERLKAYLASKLGQEQTEEIFGDEDFEKLMAAEEADKAQEVIVEAAAAPEHDTGSEDAPAIKADEGEEDSEEDEKKKSASFSENLKKREAQVAAREKQVVTQARKLLHASHLSFADELIRGGKILPTHKEKLVRALDSAATSSAKISFADGSEANAAQVLKDIFRTLPASVSFGEGVPPEKKKSDEASSFSAPDNFEADEDRMELYNKAKAYQVEHPDVSFEEAVKIVEGRT